MKLTTKEEAFLKGFLESNYCGAESAEDLLADNHSCQCVEDLMEELDLNAQEVGGFISSLEKKIILIIEERDRDVDLYWANESFLEAVRDSGQGETPFKDIDMNKVEF